MKIRIVRDQEIRVSCFESGSVRLQDVTCDFVEVETAHKKIVLIIRAEALGFVTNKAARGGGSQVSHNGHQIARLLPIRQHIVGLAVHSSINGMHHTVAFSCLRMHEESAAHEWLSLEREHHSD